MKPFNFTVQTKYTRVPSCPDRFMDWALLCCVFFIKLNTGNRLTRQRAERRTLPVAPLNQRQSKPVGFQKWSLDVLEGRECRYVICSENRSEKCSKNVPDECITTSVKAGAVCRNHIKLRQATQRERLQIDWTVMAANQSAAQQTPTRLRYWLPNLSLVKTRVVST